jgi:hypothetical protein
MCQEAGEEFLRIPDITAFEETFSIGKNIFIDDAQRFYTRILHCVGRYFDFEEDCAPLNLNIDE